MSRSRNRKPVSLEARYLSQLGRDGTRDDMLQALCRIADQLKRIADCQENKNENKNNGEKK